MEDVLAETAITYPQTYVQAMKGSQIKDVLEDVCDNLFNVDPYYQQGGDMVRLGGLSYVCAPNATIGKRISELQLDNGKALEAAKSYKVAGWASVNEQKGAPVWDVVATYLTSGKMPAMRTSRVTLKGVDGNPGVTGQG
jgi:sulfur-oxidizing protein SoxB